MGPAGKNGETPFVDVKYPLVLQEGELSFDVNTVQQILSKLIKSKTDAQQAAQNYSWLASSGGGAVGIYDNGTRVIKSVNDINFKGTGVTVTRKGKQVDIEINTGPNTPESPRTTTKFFVSTTDPGLEETLINGDRWYTEELGKVFTWIGIWVEF
jgi:hypothetical protein